MEPPSQEEILQAAFGLAKELSLDLREEELVGTFAQALAVLLPGRRLCLRVVDPRTLTLTAMTANAPLKAPLGDAPLAIKRSALRRTRLSDVVAKASRVCLDDAYQLIFDRADAGFSVPLVAAGDLLGVLNVEYPEGCDLAASDEPVVIPLANQLSVALRNLHLLGEARYYRDYLRQMMDVANALIIVIDREARIAVMNATMQRYLGLGPEVIGTSLMEVRDRLRAPEPRLGTLLLEGLDGLEVTGCEVHLARTDGTHGRALFNTSVLHSLDGGIDGVIGIGQDRDRVVSLERQVIQAEKLATLGQLAAGVVHELNNPLTSISVYGDFLVRRLEQEGAETDADKARKIVDGAARIQKLTRDLMSYARPSGELELVALNDVVRTALMFCEHVIHRAEALVEVRLQEGLPKVKAIRTQLHQVLINLVTNACHALPAPAQTVIVSTAYDPAARVLLLEVADTGVGIDELDREHIFDPFFTTKKEGSGTGLGLSIVKNIVEGHRGRIACESRPGEGTSFLITFPVGEGVDSGGTGGAKQDEGVRR